MLLLGKWRGMELENRLKEVRESKKISQNMLAEISGVSRTVINQIENGKRNNLAVGTMIKLADALECSVLDIFLFKKLSKVNNEEEKC